MYTKTLDLLSDIKTVALLWALVSELTWLRICSSAEAETATVRPMCSTPWCQTEGLTFFDLILEIGNLFLGYPTKF